MKVAPQPIGIDFVSRTTSEKIKKMLEEGYLMHTIAAACGADYIALRNFIEDHLGTYGRYSEMGYQWRQEHSMREWYDYVQDGSLIGKKSEWWDKLPFAGTIDTEHRPPIVSDKEDFRFQRLRFMTYGKE